MPDFRKAAAHGPITEVFPDVFFVTGDFKFAPGFSISRNMTVVRQKDELVVINSVRLSDDGEKELEKLGKVKHVIRAGFFHGADDPYFAHRFGATLWAAENTAKGYEKLDNGNTPLSNAKIFAFERGQKAEVIVLLEREGGVLVPCDSYQNWTTFDGCSFAGKIMMPMMGFGPVHIGGPWIRQMGVDVRADFDRLLEMPFRHLIPAHGTVLKDEAKPGLEKAMKKRFKG